jgi:protein AroM
MVMVVFTIATITIGQTPRPDIAQDLEALLPEGFRLTEYGALDGLTRQQAEERFGYRGRGELLITRLGGQGQSLKVDGEAVMRQLQTCIHRAEADGAHAALIACTGVFPKYEHSIPLLLPGEAQRRHALALAGEQTIGVVIPKADQQEQKRCSAALAGAEQPIEEAVSDVLHRAVALCVFLYFTKVRSVFQYS